MLLITIVLIETGGTYLLGIVSARSNDAVPACVREGRARACGRACDALVTLALVNQVFADAVVIDGPVAWLARTGIAGAAILMPAGFFLSSMAKGATQPNGLIALVYAGALLLGLGAASILGALLTS
ncbi:MAG: hypothetical protein ABIP77_06490 [Candidatus Limnocylindrales bacterium]